MCRAPVSVYLASVFSYLTLFNLGYKLRTRIAKALQTLSEAIRNALTRYNTEAAKLVPPRPKLSWKDVVEYTFLAEFDLLRHSRVDIRTQPWAEPSQREATLQYLYLQCAKEEIKYLNCEIRRLWTFIRDEEQVYMKTLERVSHNNLALTAALQKQWIIRSRHNAIHIARMDCIEALPGFSGVHEVGVRRGATIPLSASERGLVDPLLDDIVTLEMTSLDNGLVDRDISLEEAVDVLSIISD